MKAIHLCITYRQLLMAICDALKTGRTTTIVCPIDYQYIDIQIRYRLIRAYPNICFHFIREQAQIMSFATLPAWVPDIVRRNITVQGRPRTPWQWIPAFLTSQRFDVGYIYHSGPFLAKVLRGLCATMVLREDGLSNYVSQSLSVRKAVIRACFGLPWRAQVWGDEPWIGCVEAEHPEALPEVIRSKSVPLKLANLLSCIDDDQRLRLSTIFGLNRYIGLDEPKGCLILTQPIDLVGLCSEADKLAIYTRLVDQFQVRGYRVYLKHHPKEAPYSLGRDVEQLPTAFPIELWSSITGHRFVCCAALCSTALATNEMWVAEQHLQVVPIEYFNARHASHWLGLVNSIVVP
ncbi:alpha-2,8-polysialyltransferase family protein [Aeromonas sp. sif2416]|uniref:alpha-2,8-polysialyltransferase family protein n=1 Tax=Aeromonas sp. sif2416 TaxID=2854793 RepID=UPI001C497A83|nr:alpha-2,8-polysialyltransferase family protein [Aeromonas sp. sif2416]MBV7438485.1 alpha-2,8-polysialyltransferase family protein [Aeromonas sp. sif2416]